ncbi:MAG: capsular biosynthesis protein [Bdellovibrionales bacterium]|nr:capsular biosynthesis protein [Bdellovibrionales bacterium]
MKDVLLSVAPNAKILSVEGQKKGPVWAIMECDKHLNDNSAYLVSYCDYYMQWDAAGFLKFAIDSGCDGAIPCYTGFHPHLKVPKNVYASCKVDPDGHLLEIREKFSFETDKERAFHSPGLYFFRTGEILRKYSRRQIDLNDSINGEFYSSLTYNHMVQDGLKVIAPVAVDKFCQWGDSEDLEDFVNWMMAIGVEPL